MQHGAVEGDAGLAEGLAAVVPRVLLAHRLQPQHRALRARWERRHRLLPCPETLTSAPHEPLWAPPDVTPGDPTCDVPAGQWRGPSACSRSHLCTTRCGVGVPPKPSTPGSHLLPPAPSGWASLPGWQEVLCHGERGLWSLSATLGAVPSSPRGPQSPGSCPTTPFITHSPVPSVLPVSREQVPVNSRVITCSSQPSVLPA